MDNIEQYITKPKTVRAVQITQEMLRGTAKRPPGVIAREDCDLLLKGEEHHFPSSLRPGDWVVYYSDDYTVARSMSDKMFRDTFDRAKIDR